MKHFIVILLTSLMLMSICSCNLPRKQREQSRHVVDSTIVELKKQQITPVIAATELIALKNSNIELDMLDSVFKTIPDEIIIFICNNDNLDLETLDSYGLAKLYLSNKEYYNNIIDKYNKIEKFKGHDKKVFKPDTIPNKPKQDTTILQ